MVKRWIKKTGLYASCLLLGISGYAMLRNIARKNAPRFVNTEVVIGKDTVSMQKFYENLQFKDAAWLYTASDGKIINVDSLCNTEAKNKKIHSHYARVKLRECIDTVYVSYRNKKIKEKNDSDIIYKIGALDSLPSMPSMGKQNYDVLTVREFIADNPKLQSVMDVYNDKFNCTHRHEYQHYLNMIYGIREWNSYSIKFVECCEDELSANIAQLLEQRRNYFAHNRNPEYITSRFKFYRDALQIGTVKAYPDRISLDEVQFIADGVFDAWMKDKYDIYAKLNNSRVRSYNHDANYIAVQENQEAHETLMRKCLSIDGYDFWPYVKEREKEIFDRISQEQRKDYAALSRSKFRKMTYMDKLEYLKSKDGEKKYDNRLRENWLTAKVIKLFGKDR